MQSNTGDLDLEAIKFSVLDETRKAIAMLRQFCPYGRHFFP